MHTSRWTWTDRHPVAWTACYAATTALLWFLFNAFVWHHGIARAAFGGVIFGAAVAPIIYLDRRRTRSARPRASS